MNELLNNVTGIDHLAVAVPDLNAAIDWVKNTLGFVLDDTRVTRGKSTGMKSAVMRLGPVTIVLTEGIGETSQTTKFVENFGAGVQHVAFKVNDIHEAIKVLHGKGLKFSSEILESDGLLQIFSLRDPSTGLMVELIQRHNFDGFRDENVQRLFDSLEENDLF